MSTVKIKGDKAGNIITSSENNPEFGWIFVEQTANEFSNGWLRTVKRSARIMGNVDSFKNSGFKKGTDIPGKIIVIESLTPFTIENPDRDLKIAGQTGVICRFDDQPIYRQAIFTTDLNAFDQFVSHNNIEEIKQVQEAQRALNALTEATPTEL